MKSSKTEILREYGRFAGAERVNGVTYDGGSVWFVAGDRLNALDPKSGKSVRSIEVADGVDQFFCGGGESGKVRAVRRPRSRR